MKSGPATLAKWCEQAVAMFGPDWVEIRKYVHERLSELSEEERRKLECDCDVLLEQPAMREGKKT